MSKTGWVALGVVLLAVAAVGVWLWHGQQVAAAKAAVQARMGTSQALWNKVDALVTQEDRAEKRYNAATAAADAAGDRRHDNGVSANPDFHVQALAIHEEVRQTKIEQAAFNAEIDAMDRVADAFADAYGEDAVSRFRSSIDRYREERQIELNNRSAAVTDIDDDYTASENGTSTHTDDTAIQAYYQASADAEARAQTLQGSAFTQQDALLNRVTKEMQAELAEDKALK